MQGRQGARGEAAATALALLILIVIGGILARCLKAASPPADVLLGLDTSASLSPEERRVRAGLFEQTVDTAVPAGSRVTAWTFARNVNKTYEGRPAGARDLWPALDAWRKAGPQPGSGTCPHRVLEAMLAPARAGSAVGIVLLTDAEDADPAATARAARALAEIKSVRVVWVVGATRPCAPA